MTTLTLDEEAEEYHQQLLDHQAGLDWHHQRGINLTTIREHRLGWITEPLSKQAEWAVDRPVIPYLTPRAGCVELKARTGRKPGPKYLKLGSEFPLPTKMRLYNALHAMPSPRTGQVLVVEGEYDTLIALQAGYRACGIAGVQGWNRTWEHLFQDSEVVVVCDGDQAGREAAEKLVGMLEQRTIKCRAASLPEGSDLTDLWLDGGKDRVRKVVG